MNEAHAVATRQAEHQRLYFQAFDMLQREFITALTAGPTTQVPTPHQGELEEAPIVLLVQRQMDVELDNYIINHLLELLVRAAGRGDSDAVHLIERMARTHSAYYCALMQDSGDFRS